MTPVVCVIGEQDSGKTTLIEKLIGEFVRRGYRVSTVKHTAHSFELDREGSDSYRHTKAGADKVALSHLTQFAMIEKRMAERGLDDIVHLLEPDTDIILAEGYKGLKDYPKIKLIKDSKKIVSKEENLIATVGSGRPIKKDIPDFDINDPRAIVDFLEEKFMRKRIEEVKDNIVQLKVNGKDIRVKNFVQDILAKAILGMISTLRGTEKPKEVEIRIKV
jgi:molybdopterin-guanine dinucleotide biosynthesis protein B